MSPEQSIYKYSNKSDIWSVGVCLYILLSIEPLYDHVQNYKYNIIFLENISTNCNDLLNKMIQKNICDRISIKDCLKHEWFNNIQKKNR